MIITTIATSLSSRVMPSNPVRQSTSRALRIMYADDLCDLRELMRLVLEHEGHALESFADASEAWARLQSSPGDFDLVITDHHMPVMNGLEFVRRIRRLPYAGKVIAFSSEFAPGVRNEYLALKVDRVLAKPVHPADLYRVLAELFPTPAPP